MEVINFQKLKTAERWPERLRRIAVRREVAQGTGLPAKSGLMELFGASRPTLWERFVCWSLIADQGSAGVVLMANIRYPRIGGSTPGTRRHHPDLPIALRAPCADSDQLRHRRTLGMLTGIDKHQCN